MADEEFDEEKINDEHPLAATNPDMPLIYVGPNIPKLGMSRYTIYKGDLPSEVEAAIEKIPEIKKMLIPVDALMSYTRELLIPSSPERLYNKIIQDKIKNL